MATDILIVDDEADIRELVSGILADEGHGTRTANSDEALALIAARRPHLVLLDIWLQGSRLDGLQLLEIIKQQHPTLPVVMISGHGNIETAVSAIKLGAYDFIEKPFKADRLILVAERALETSRLKREVTRAQRARSSRQPDRRPLDRRSTSCARSIEQVGAGQFAHPDLRRAGRRQGTGGAHDPRPFGARDRPLRRHQRGRPSRPRGWRPSCSASRAASGRSAPGRRARGGAWRHALPRRGRRHAARDAGQDPARAGRPELPARRRHRRASMSTCASSRRSSRDLAGGDRRGRLPRGPVPPPLGGADPRALARRAARGHPRTDRVLHGADLGHHRPAAAADRRRRDGGAAVARLARQHPPAPQQRRAADDPGGRRPRRRDHRRRCCPPRSARWCRRRPAAPAARS